jgi:UDP-4-amino-4-deoxy-L-arabinose-oxoglutarate aminotransferase
MKVDFYRHSLTEAETASVAETLQSTFLTSGPKTKAFEEQFAAYFGAKYAVGVTSWTMGNFIALKALGIGPGDEVITTPMSFVATGNTVLYCGAKLVLVDADPLTGNISIDAVKTALTPRTKAILPVHLYGQMVDMQALRDVVADRNIAILEDCAHCVEGARDGIKPAMLSTAAVFSFYATKNLTCGEGGAIVTNNEELYQKLLVYRLHGMNKSAADRYHGLYKHWDMESLGWKCNMNDVQAAMLLPQLPRLAGLLAERERIAQRYHAGFATMAGVTMPAVMPHSTHARHLFTIQVDPDKRDAMLHALQQKQIGVAVNFRAFHLLDYYQKQLDYRRGMYPVAEKIGDSTITLPFYPSLRDDEIDYVIDSVREALGRV